MKRLQMREFGSPSAVPELIEVDASEPAPGQVLVGLEAAPINPSDLLLIRGWYGHRPTLPAALGTEGVGTIIGVGEGVDPARLRERVMILPNLKQGTWQDQVALDEHDAVTVDPTADLRQLAMLGVNPVAADLLLRRFVYLEPGAWVGQTGGTSAVGRSVISLAKARGVRTLSVVRRPESAAELLGEGADAVVVDGPDLREQIAAALGAERFALVLDAVAGEATAALAARAERGSTVVSYGGMSGRPVSVAPADLIFRDLSVRGFWQKRWLDTASREEVAEVYARLAPLVADGSLTTAVASCHPLESYQEALAAATASDRPGKVLFTWEPAEGAP